MFLLAIVTVLLSLLYGLAWHNEPAREPQVRRINSECSADTPFTLCEPRNASVPMRTHRPRDSSMIDTSCSGGASGRSDAANESKCCLLIS